MPFILSESQAQRLATASGVTLEESRDDSSPNIQPETSSTWRRPMTNQERLSGFLSIWLAKCVVPTREVVTIGVILPAVHLAHGVQIALVPAVIANTQHGLREVAASFLKDS